jgi:3-oxoacyl-[acyl-carrier-protein] synthase III
MSDSPHPMLTRPGNQALPTVSIVATGMYVPERIMTNADLEKMVDTSDEWIFTRSGIRERRIAAAQEATSDLAAAAARNAMQSGGIAAEEIDLILVATCTPDMPFPSTACYVQKLIGARNATCLDVSAACSGFLYAMETARQFIQSGSMKTALVIGAEKMSTVLDWTDRTTCVLFGDGAGAAILQANGADYGILTSVLGSDGSLSDLLSIPGGGSRHPASPAVLDERLTCIKMAGREVFKHAVTHMANASLEALAQCGARIEDIACIIPHQANARIIQAIGQRIGAPLEKFYLNMDRYGNTSAASVIMALDEAGRTGRIQRGDLILMVVFGGGFTWAASLVEW